MNHKIISGLLLGMLCTSCDRNQQAECTTEYLVKLTTASDEIRTWDSLYGWFKKFNHCDDHSGEHGESLDDAVAKLLANDWEHFSRFITLSEQDKEFENFVLSYISPTANSDDLDKALRNAEKECPVKADFVCDAIIKELRDSRKKQDAPIGE